MTTAFCLTHGDYELIVGDSLQFTNTDDTPATLYQVRNTISGVIEWEGQTITHAITALKTLSEAWDSRHQALSSLAKVAPVVSKLGGKGDVHH